MSQVMFSIDSFLEDPKFTKPKSALTKNNNFVQFYLEDNLHELLQLKNKEKDLLLILVSEAFKGHPNLTEIAWCIYPYRELCKKMKTSRTTIWDCIKKLEKTEWIKIFKSDATNVYAINPKKVWKSGYDNRWKALYNRKIGEGETFTIRGNIVINGCGLDRGEKNE